MFDSVGLLVFSLTSKRVVPGIPNKSQQHSGQILTLPPACSLKHLPGLVQLCAH